MKKPQCSCCLKEVDIDTYLKTGGLCQECSTEIDKIFEKEETLGVRRYYIKKREEAVKRE